MTIPIEVGRYRTGMAGLLDDLVRVVGETERRLDVAVSGGKEPLQAVLKEDSTGAYRMYWELHTKVTEHHWL